MAWSLQKRHLSECQQPPGGGVLAITCGQPPFTFCVTLADAQLAPRSSCAGRTGPCEDDSSHPRIAFDWLQIKKKTTQLVRKMRDELCHPAA